MICGRCGDEIDPNASLRGEYHDCTPAPKVSKITVPKTPIQPGWPATPDEIEKDKQWRAEAKAKRDKTALDMVDDFYKSRPPKHPAPLKPKRVHVNSRKNLHPVEPFKNDPYNMKGMHPQTIILDEVMRA